MKILIIGIGNPGRQDDGLGTALVDKVEKAKMEPVSPFSNIGLEWRYQLNIEDAHAVKDTDLVVFADATREGDAPATLGELVPAAEIAFTTHAMTPASVLALSEELYGRAPRAYALAIRGYSWDIGEELSRPASANLETALSLLADFLTRLKSSEKTS